MSRYFSIRWGKRTHYPFIRWSKRRVLRWLYITLALLVIALVLAYIYLGKNKDEDGTILTGTDVKSETKAPSIVAPRPEPELEPALAEIAPVPTSEPNTNVAALIAAASAHIDARPARIIEARDSLNEALPMSMSSEQRDVVKEQLSNLADKWLFNRRIYAQDSLCSSYKVKRGDQLRTISRQFKVPYEILMEINKISRPEVLQAEETIKVIKGPFHARVYRSTFTMDLYLQNTFVRSFPVGLGQPGMETPTGTWLVKPEGKLITPTWTDPVSGKTYEPEDPDYPLGSRWIGLEGITGGAKGRTGFAIHGTKNPSQIGTASSQGCIRLHNGDAILIYNLLMSGFSQVVIVE